MPVAFCAALKRSLLNHGGVNSSATSSPSSSWDLNDPTDGTLKPVHEESRFGLGVDSNALEVVKRAGVCCSSLTKSFEGRITVVKKYEDTGASGFSRVTDLPYERAPHVAPTATQAVADSLSLASSIEECGRRHPTAILRVVKEFQESIGAAFRESGIDVLRIRDSLRRLAVLDIGVAILAETKIGKTVKPLRREEVTGDATIVKLATQLIDEWRRLASDDMPLEAREATGSGFYRDDAIARSVRSRHIQLLRTALSRPSALPGGEEPADEREKQLLQLSREIEREVYEMIGRSADSPAYRTKIRQLTSNLRSKDSALRQRVADYSLSVEVLCRMSTEQLASSATRAERSKMLQEREVQDRGNKALLSHLGGFVGSGLRKCPSCGARSATTEQVDSEWISAGGSKLELCSNCGHRWESD